VFSERTSVGLDVHARSVVACGLDTVTGQLYRQRLTPSVQDINRWLGTLPGPVAVAYEAGPTGYGLARFLNCAGVRCVVVAPSKLQRPPGDRVKTDARDAAHLARLLRMDQITAVRVPSPDEEAAPDLVRAREDVRSDLMRSRHRVSKLLLRQGIIWSGGAAWTGKDELWLRQQQFGVGANRTFIWPEPLAGVDHQDGEHPCPQVAGRGGVASRQALPHARFDAAGTMGRRRPPPPKCVATWATHGCMSGGRHTPPGRSDPSSPTSRSPGSWPAGAGRWPPSSNLGPSRPPEPPGGGPGRGSAWSKLATQL